MSACTPSARPPAESIRATTGDGSTMSAIATVTPCSAKTAAVSDPMAPAPPVMTPTAP